VKFPLLETVESVSYLRRGASCYLVYTVVAENVITCQATGVRLSNGIRDHAPLHPQDIEV
jgi:hypothetical protein